MSALVIALALVLAFLVGIALSAAVLAVSAMQRNTQTPAGARAPHAATRAETPRQDHT